MMRAINIRVQSRKFIVKRVTHKALRGQVITFVWFHLPKYLVYAGKTFQRSGMQVSTIQYVLDSNQPVARILQGDTPDEAMDLIAFSQ
jgi:hypothetical protein